MVPKTIMFFLVNTTKDQMQNDLVCSLYKEDLLGTCTVPARIELLLISTDHMLTTTGRSLSVCLYVAGDLMREEEDISQRRRNCREMHGLLRRAMEIVNEVRDFNTFK